MNRRRMNGETVVDTLRIGILGQKYLPPPRDIDSSEGDVTIT